ncbi:hypothetical protein JL722_8151 [Aureococcus anophagefferens]|nr:hypothetical protein JL722_8151 [Aureococcus anophagefferens]
MGSAYVLAAIALAAGANALVPTKSFAPTAARAAPATVTMMGRKFENNKLKMAKTAAAYTKKASLIGKKIKVAVRAGGPDPDSNRALGLIIKEAQALNVKREIVDRNIKAAARQDGADFKELTYELYLHGGAGVVINALSDNNNRAFSDVGTVVKKANLKLAESGSVLHNFLKKGRITVNADLDEDAAIELALEADVDEVEVVAPDADMRSDGEEPIAGTLVECGEDDLEKNLLVLDKLAEVDDVDTVEHNILFAAD